MTAIKISFDKEQLFDRCRVDVINKSMQMPEMMLDMSEHDRAWFDVALNAAAADVECELSRIARNAEAPMEADEANLVFEIDATTNSHAAKLAHAIENFITAKVCEEWAAGRGLELRFGATDRAGYLKHLTLKKITQNV